MLAFFSRFRELPPGGGSSPDLLERLDGRARGRAEGFLEAVRLEPASFPRRILRESDLLLFPRHDSYADDLREAGGELPRYHKGLFAGALEGKIPAALRSGDFFGPVQAPNGYYVGQLVRRAPVAFEEVKEELRAIYLTRPATAREIHALRGRLLAKAKIVRAGG